MNKNSEINTFVEFFFIFNVFNVFLPYVITLLQSGYKITWNYKNKQSFEYIIKSEETETVRHSGQGCTGKQMGNRLVYCCFWLTWTCTIRSPANHIHIITLVLVEKASENSWLFCIYMYLLLLTWKSGFLYLHKPETTKKRQELEFSCGEQLFSTSSFKNIGT